MSSLPPFGVDSDTDDLSKFLKILSTFCHSEIHNRLVQHMKAKGIFHRVDVQTFLMNESLIMMTFASDFLINYRTIVNAAIYAQNMYANKNTDSSLGSETLYKLYREYLDAEKRKHIPK